MRSRLPRVLVAVCAALTFALLPAHSPAGNHAEVICPNGTNWDNVIGACR